LRITNAAMLVVLATAALDAQQPLLGITSPAPPNNVFNPGQTITITVAADPSVKSQSIWINQQDPLPDAQPTSMSNQFTMALPVDMAPGVYTIAPGGATSTGAVFGPPVRVDVERADPPTHLSASPLFMDFETAGHTLSIDVQATFADGSAFDMSKSTKVQFASHNTQIATVDSNGLVTAVAPGNTYILVTYPAGSSTPPAVPVIVTVPQPARTGPAPVITGVSPASGIPGVTKVTVTGSGFGDKQGLGNIAIGTTSGGPITSWSDQQIVATVQSGSYPGPVRVEQNGQYSNAFPFTILAPIVRSVNPNNGSQGTRIIITGSNFGTSQKASTLRINQGVANPTDWADDSITANVPASATTGDLVVVVNDVGSNAVLFTAPPVITAVSASTAKLGDSITISGSNYGTGGNGPPGPTVVINGATASLGAWSPTSISTTVPPGATLGNGSITVTVNNITSNSTSFAVFSATDGARSAR
jgi:hypothetical protein